jgi:hypothetical protein
MTTLHGLEKLNEIRDGALANREFRMSPHAAGTSKGLKSVASHLDCSEPPTRNLDREMLGL